MQVLALTRGELLRHEVVLHTELAGEDEPVMGDRVVPQQVLLNLIMNGVEAMKDVTERARERRYLRRLRSQTAYLFR
jgi:C4-dicarboxylate-specific signal transduction histidine kinase